MSNYYKDQLNKLKPDNEYHQNIIISDNQGNKTKTLSLNEESIPVIIEFLKNELIRLNEIKN